MDMNFDKPIIPYYSPISAKGGKRRKLINSRKLRSTRKFRSRKYKGNNTRTRRRYH
jgi:hypothetical protein